MPMRVLRDREHENQFLIFTTNGTLLRLAPSRTFTPKSFVINVNQRSFKDPENTNADNFTVCSPLLVTNRAGASGAIRCEIFFVRVVRG
jgi:hypothetical protein